MTLLSFFAVNSVCSQTVFTNVDFHLKIVTNQQGKEILYSDSSLSLSFQLNQKSVKLQDNFAFIDSQLIQITPLKVTGFTKSLSALSAAEQKQFLSDYSQYELDYITKELQIEVIDPHNQWVPINSRNWFIWYFRVGSEPVPTGKKIGIQLFASTIIGGKVLTINAPMFAAADFNKAGLIVNQMMESLAEAKK
ncbi:MAG: hypothetical protein ACJ75B_04980 [Flavisolibacter sp.]